MYSYVRRVFSIAPAGVSMYLTRFFGTVVILQYPFFTNRLMKEFTSPRDICRVSDNSRCEVGLSAAMASKSCNVLRFFDSIISWSPIAPPFGLHLPMCLWGGGKYEMQLAWSLTRSSIEHKSWRESIVKMANLKVGFENNHNGKTDRLFAGQCHWCWSVVRMIALGWPACPAINGRASRPDCIIWFDNRGSRLQG